MAKYIPLDAILTEIENLLDKGKYHDDYNCAYRDGNNGALYALKGKLNTFEVKEVDFDAEWERYFEHRGEMATVNVKHLAKYFFELGVNTSNPLTWKDIKLIWNITDEMDNMPEEEFYKEVLKQFKERKEK